MILALMVFASCKQKKEGPAQKARPPLVTVTTVKQKTVPVWINYIGNTVAMKSVDIRARVEGFLQKRSFVEGADVKKRDLVFVIDPRSFQAELERNLAQLAKDEAAVAFAREQVERYRTLADEDFVAREKYDDFRTQEKQASAAVEASKAAIKQARLNLSYCTMRSPLNGRIGRTLVNVGNLVGAGEKTKLATIVQLDPIYVYFSPSEEDLREILKYKQKGDLPVKISRSNGEKYPHQGKLDFIDNIADQTTGTVTMRAVVPNPAKALRPGMYVNIKLFILNVPNTVLIPQKAIGEDQGGIYVYVVDKDKKVEERHVVTGFVHEDMQIVWKGLKAGEKIIVEGLQMVRPGMVVRTEMASSKDAREETTGKSSKDSSGKDSEDHRPKGGGKTR